MQTEERNAVITSQEGLWQKKKAVITSHEGLLAKEEGSDH